MSTPASGRPGSTFGPAAGPSSASSITPASAPAATPAAASSPDPAAGPRRPRVRPRVRPATLRRWVRLVFALICLAGGLQLALYLLHAAGRIAFAAPRAPVVEGFLPIAALLGLKRWLTGGGFDPVHPAGLVILLAALASSFLLRRGFCGHVCPVGWLSEGLGRLGARLGLGRRGPRVLDWTLGAVKWLVLAFFLVQVGGMGAAALREFVTGPYNITADARLLTFWLAPSRVTLTALAGLVALGLLFRNAWCRWLCPYGALLGLAALTGPTALRRDPAACTGCGLCERNCPAGIHIMSRESLRGAACLGCGQCAANCPGTGGAPAIAVRALGRRISWRWLCLGAAGVMLGAWLLALALGVWHAHIPAGMLDALYRRALIGN